jgi:hypothetical protein
MTPRPSATCHAPPAAKQLACIHTLGELVMPTSTYELAAECFNTCRAQGVQGSNNDFLICAAGGGGRAQAT